MIPNDFSNKLKRGKDARVQVLIDGSDSTVAINALNYATLISQAFLRPKIEGFEVRPRVFYNPEMRSVNFTVPGLIGVILMNITLLLTSLTIVRERERGTIEKLIVSPIKAHEIMIGKIIPYIAIAFINITIVLLFAVLVFNVSIRGNIILLLLLSLIFVTS